ncbi:MAG: DUF4935 domain-containing protein [Actinobacteria bacterium]|nr:DUF4935 domain-containing protein [Actinomycetota bacterium]
MRRLLPETAANTLDDRTIDKSCRAMLENLEGVLRRSFSDIVPHPTVPHADMLARSLARRKPFDSAGHKWYQDTLIWEIALGKLRSGTQHLAFVTGNTKDFLDDCRKRHPHLVDDIESLQLSLDVMSIYETVDAFIVSESRPALRILLTAVGPSGHSHPSYSWCLCRDYSSY